MTSKRGPTGSLSAIADAPETGPTEAFQVINCYYEERANEYDSTSYREVLRDPLRARDLRLLERFFSQITDGRVLDIGCGTGWLTKHVRGKVVGIDQSPTMLRLAARRLPHAFFVRGVVPPLPFPDDSFDVALSSHVYSHIDSPAVGEQFIREALRVAPQLIIAEQAWHDGLPTEGWETRSLRNGNQHHVYKRYFSAPSLADEIGGRVELDTDTFVAVRVTRRIGRRRDSYGPAEKSAGGRHDGPNTMLRSRNGLACE